MSTIRLLRRHKKPIQNDYQENDEFVFDQYLQVLLTEILKAVEYDESKAIQKSALFRLFCSFKNYQTAKKEKWTFAAYLVTLRLKKNEFIDEIGTRKDIPACFSSFDLRICDEDIEHIPSYENSFVSHAGTK